MDTETRQTRQTRQTKQAKKFPVWRFLIVTTLFWCAQYTYTAYFTPWLEELQIASQLIGTITGAYGFSQFLIRIPLGAYADHNGKHRPVILAGLLILIIPGLLLRFTQLPALILLARFLAGVAASTWVSFTVFYQNALRGETNRNMGTINAANSAGLLAGYLVSTLLINRIGMNGLFVLSSAFSLLGAILFITCPSLSAFDLGNKGANELPPFRETFCQKELLGSAGLMAFLQFLVFATVQSFSANVAVSTGIAHAYLGIFSAIFTAAGLLAQAYIAKRSEQGPSDRMLLILGFLALCAHAVVLPHLQGIIWFGIMYFIAGIGRGLITPLLMANAIRRTSPARRGTAMGTFQSIYSIGMFLGPQFMGIFIKQADGLYAKPFHIMGIFALLAVGLSLLLPISTEEER